MGIGIIEMLILLFMFGGFAMVVALVAWAFAKGRGGMALAIGGLVFLGLLVLVPLAGIFYAMAANRVVPGREIHANRTTESFDPIADAAWAQNGFQSPDHHGWQSQVNSGVPQQNGWQINSGVPPQNGWQNIPQPTWSIALAPVLFIIVGLVALLALVAKRAFGHSAAGGRGKIWPVFVALPVLGLFLLGGIRFQSIPRSSVNVYPAPSPPQAPSSPKVPQVIVPAQIAAARQHALAKRVESLNQQAASANKQLAERIDQMDIQELMDQFDAPRIVLESPVAPTTNPGAFIVIAAPQIVATAAESARQRTPRCRGRSEGILQTRGHYRRSPA